MGQVSLSLVQRMYHGSRLTNMGRVESTRTVNTVNTRERNFTSRVHGYAGPYIKVYRKMYIYRLK